MNPESNTQTYPVPRTAECKAQSPPWGVAGQPALPATEYRCPCPVLWVTNRHTEEEVASRKTLTMAVRALPLPAEDDRRTGTRRQDVCSSRTRLDRSAYGQRAQESGGFSSFPTTAVERTISAHGSTHGVAREFPHHWHCVAHNRCNVTGLACSGVQCGTLLGDV